MPNEALSPDALVALYDTLDDAGKGRVSEMARRMIDQQERRAARAERTP